MIAFATDVRLKRGVPRAVLGLIVGTFAIHVLFTSFIDLGWITLDAKWRIQAFNLANPDPFQWLLALLSHGNYWHWFGNMVYLWIFGSILEDRLGPWQFLGLFLVSGACADILNIVVIYSLCAFLGYPIPEFRSLGASGAVSGIMGLAMFRFYKARVRVWLDGIGFFPFLRWSIPIWIFCAWFFVKQIFGLLFSFGGTNYMAHIGGFLGGVIAGPLLGFKKQNYEELLWDKAQALKEDGFHSMAAEELIAQLPQRPNDPVIHRDIAECLYKSQSLGRRGKAEVRLLALSHYLKAIDHYAHQGRLKEAVDQYARLLGPFKRDEIPDTVHERMENLAKKGYASTTLIREDPEAKRARLEKEVQDRMNAGDSAGAHAALNEMMTLDVAGRTAPLTLYLGAEAAARQKDTWLAEKLFEQVAQKGDERQTMRALLYLARLWLKTPRQTRLSDLHRISRERHPDIGLNPEWVDLGAKLKQ